MDERFYSLGEVEHALELKAEEEVIFPTSDSLHLNFDFYDGQLYHVSLTISANDADECTAYADTLLLREKNDEALQNRILEIFGGRYWDFIREAEERLHRESERELQHEESLMYD